MLCLKAAKKDAQKALTALRAKGAFCSQYEVGHEGAFVYLPIRASAKAWAAKAGFGAVVKKTLKAAKKRPKSLRDELGGVLSPAELEHLLSSFDIIGDIAMLEVPPPLTLKQALVAEAIMRLYPHVKTVVKKTEGTGGQYRIRPVEVIAGEKKTETLSRENGCSFLVDLNRAYYNPRMSAERMRIIKQMKKGENVLVLFAGVGPYAIAAEKNTLAGAKPARIIAIELNPDAVEFMRKNIALNKCKKIEAVEGDVSAVLARPSLYLWADRIIMPHPTEALRFLPPALDAARDGAIIHLYAFGPADRPMEGLFEQAQEIAEKKGRPLKLRSWRVMQTYSPTLVQVVLDLECTK